MKKFRSTWIMSLFVIALAGYTFWEYRKAQDEGAPSDTEKKLFNLKAEEVDQILITHGTDVIQIARQGAVWNMLKPVEDEAESTVMDAFLYSALGQKGKVFRGEEEKDKKWAEFGLAPPGSVLEIKGKGKTERLEVSSKNAFDGSFYVRKGEELLLGDKGLAQAVGREASSFRSHHLWRLGDVDVNGIDLNEGNAHFALKKAGDKWEMEPKPEYAIDGTRVDDWLKKLRNLNTGGVASDTASEDDKRTDLLLKPTLVAKIQYKKPEGAPADWTLTVGQDKDEDIYLYSTTRPTIYKTQKTAMDYVRVPAEYFRDGKKGFRFPLESAREIEVIRGDFHHVFKKVDTAWKLADATDAVTDEVDQDKLILLVQRVLDLEATDFHPAKSLGKTAGQIVVKGDQGHTLLDLSWGDEYKGKQPFNKDMTFRLVKTNLEKDIVGVKAEKINSLIDPALLKKKADVAPPKAQKK